MKPLKNITIHLKLINIRIPGYFSIFSIKEWYIHMFHSNFELDFSNMGSLSLQLLEGNAVLRANLALL